MLHHDDAISHRPHLLAIDLFYSDAAYFAQSPLLVRKSFRVVVIVFR
jgi:hypothetical protein